MCTMSVDSYVMDKYLDMVSNNSMPTLDQNQGKNGNKMNPKRRNNCSLELYRGHGHGRTFSSVTSGSSGSLPSPPPPPHGPPQLPSPMENGMVSPTSVTTALDNLPTKTSDEKLLDLTNKTKYSLVQRNGQRIYGGPPPDWNGAPPPEKGCEIFVGKVPRDCYEDELVPIFATVGKIYELRLMMDFSGSNRGYFFVRYTNREDAKKAVRQLNNYEIRPGKNLGVIHSVDNRKLWISGIPKNRSASDIKLEMERITEGVRDVILYQSQTDKSKTRGYAFVEYDSHRAAALARRKLVPGRIFLLGQEIEKVDWAEPENEVDEEIMNKVRILFIRNLMTCTSEEKIREVFEEISGGKVERVKKTKDYAFVHFVTREAAEEAVDKVAAEGLNIDGSDIEVNWSKPVDKTIYNTRKQLTKILSTGGAGGHATNGIAPGLSMGYDAPLAQLNGMPMQSLPPLPIFNNGGGYNRGISPRRRGAAGIRGLGAPGTAPPRRLVKMSHQMAAINALEGANNGIGLNTGALINQTQGGGPINGAGGAFNGALPPHLVSQQPEFPFHAAPHFGFPAPPFFSGQFERMFPPHHQGGMPAMPPPGSPGPIPQHMSALLGLPNGTHPSAPHLAQQQLAEAMNGLSLETQNNNF